MFICVVISAQQNYFYKITNKVKQMQMLLTTQIWLSVKNH